MYYSLETTLVKVLFRERQSPVKFTLSTKTVVRDGIVGELGDYPVPQGPAVRIYFFLKFIT